jgi:transposase
MGTQRRQVYGGADTHGRTHHAAAIDSNGKVLGDQEFPATPAGYRELLSWLRRLGDVVTIEVEGTGSYCAGLARAISADNVAVVEADRPDRRASGRQVGEHHEVVLVVPGCVVEVAGAGDHP